MLEGKDFAWTGMLEAAAKHVPKNETGAEFHFVSTAGNPAGQGGPEPLPEKGVISMGKMPQMKWWQEVAMGKAMVSRIKCTMSQRSLLVARCRSSLHVTFTWVASLEKGRVVADDSAYDAMCFGVPFINV